MRPPLTRWQRIVKWWTDPVFALIDIAILMVLGRIILYLWSLAR